jgi:hypothetical protein
MDAAALELALNPSRRKASMRLTLRAGFTCLREIAEVEEIPYDADPDPDSEIALTYEEFVHALDRLRYAGYKMEREGEDAWAHFRGWRVNYESLAYELAYRDRRRRRALVGAAPDAAAGAGGAHAGRP